MPVVRCAPSKRGSLLVVQGGDLVEMEVDDGKEGAGQPRTVGLKAERLYFTERFLLDQSHAKGQRISRATND